MLFKLESSLGRTVRLLRQLILTGTCLLGLQAAPEDDAPRPIRLEAIRFAETRPWRDLAEESAQAGSRHWIPSLLTEDHDVQPGPGPRRLRRHGAGSAPIVDPLVRPNLATGTMPDPLSTFEGLSGLDNRNVYELSLSPSDCNGDIGPDHYVEAVNSLYRVFDRTGKPLMPPSKFSTLFAALGEPASKYDDGDPVVRYDRMADRWVILAFVVSDWLEGLGPAHTVVAVSKTPDPTGPFFVYDFPMPNNLMNDYPKLGIWPNGYYVSINQFGPPPEYTFEGAGVFALDRRRMLRGDSSASAAYVDLGKWTNQPSSLLPADLDGAPPAEGTPHVFASLVSPEVLANPPVKPRSRVRGTGSMETDANGEPVPYGIRWFTLTPDFVHTEASSVVELPVTPVAPFRMALGDLLVPQRGVTNGLDPLSDRLMNRLQFRRFNGHESLVVNHSVQVDPSGVLGVRHYEFRRMLPNGGIFLHDQGTHSPDSDSRWMGSVALDWQGNLAIGYSVSGTNSFPGIRYAGRTHDAPAGGINLSEAILQAGSASQEFFRWGDYNTLAVDPVDDSTFWYVNNYLTQSKRGNWQTRIGSFRFTNSIPRPLSSLEVAVVDAATGQPVPEASVTVGNGYWRRHDGPGGVRFRIEAGSQRVVAEALGYLPATNTVTVLPGTNTVVSLSLRIVDHDVHALGPQTLFLTGRAGGPFDTNGVQLSLTNSGAKPTSWEAAWGSAWTIVTPSQGILPPHGGTTITVRIADAATNLPPATYPDSLLLSIPETGAVLTRQLRLDLTPNPGDLQFRRSWTPVDFKSPTVDLVVDRVEGTGGAVSVELDTVGIGAVEGTDFQGQHRSILFREGETQKTLQIPISGSEGRPSKSFRIVLKAPTGGAGLGTNRETFVTLTDDRGLVAREFLENNPAWTTAAPWAFGRPSGGNKPSGGYTGANVYAYGLDRDYPNGQATAEFLVTKPFDASGHRNLSLYFARWLTIERGLSDQASVEVSTNGVDWTRVWSNPREESLNAREWVRQSIPLPSWTDGSPTLQVRWGLGPTDTSRQGGGWSIDDIELFGDPVPQVLGITLDTRSGADSSIVLSWASRPGETFAVESSEGLGQPFRILQQDLPSTPPLTLYTNRISEASLGRLLRVRRQ